MDPEDDFNRYRLRTRVQVVAVIDILVGTVPFINLAFDFNDKDLAEQWKDRENLVLLWTVLLCVYVVQLLAGFFLLAATRDVHSEYTIGNCQVWFYVAIFTFVFYTGEMAYAISSIINTPASSRSIKLVNNFIFDITRPVCTFLSKGSYQYKYYYHARLGIPLPSRRMSMAAINAYPVPANNPNYTYYSTYPQPHSKLVAKPRPQQPMSPRFPQPVLRPPQLVPRPPQLAPRPPQLAPTFTSRTPYHHYRPQVNCNSNVNLNRNYVYHDGMAARLQ